MGYTKQLNAFEQHLDTLEDLIDEKFLSPVDPKISFAIGDVQGCFDELRTLLDKIEFDPEKHNLWFAGDLVNRGPNSLQVLRFVRALGDSAITVLGNHDLQLLAAAEGFLQPRQRDTISGILEAPDIGELLEWLRFRPLMHYDASLNYMMAHAGIYPKWDLDQTQACARELETALQGEHYRDFLEQLSNWSNPRKWSPDLQGIERLSFISNCFTEMRYCDNKGRIHLNVGSKEAQKRGLVPWYEVPKRVLRKTPIIFGHWASLSSRKVKSRHVFSLDNGCVQGGKLTAIRLQDRIYFNVRCLDAKAYS
jgi:bis(5'-nucleosyl)-tetraphosphatase (symmetrical)